VADWCDYERATRIRVLTHGAIKYNKIQQKELKARTQPTKWRELK